MTRISTNKAKHPGLVLAAALLIPLLQSPPAFAVQSAHFPTPTDYALKIHEEDGKPRYVDVPAATGEVYVCYKFKRIINWQRPPDQSADASAYQVKLNREGDAIKIDLSVVFAPTEQFRTMPIVRTLPTKGLRGQPIGSYSARLGETLSLQELANFGIEPIRVSVVSSRSRMLDPSEIRNETKAIQVVRADKARGHYQIVIKNISSKNIVSVRMRIGSSGSGGGPRIAPGEVYTTGFVDPTWDPSQDDGPSKQVHPKVVISDVVFADLTFEGEKEFAIRTAATKRGARIQWVRIVSLLQAAIEGVEQDSQAALDNLRRQISALSEEAESHVVDELARYFLPLTEKQRAGLISELKDSLKSEKRYELAVISYLEVDEARKGTPRKSWLTDRKKAYEEALKKQP